MSRGRCCIAELVPAMTVPEGNHLLNQPDEDPKPSRGWTWYDTRLPTRLTDFESIQVAFIHGGS